MGRGALRPGGELELDELRSSHGLAERRPELRLQRADAVEAASFARIDAIADVPAAQPLVTSTDCLPRSPLCEHERKPADRTVGHGDVEPPAFAAAKSADERALDRERNGRSVERTVEAKHARGSGIVDVMPGVR